jgi:hypothetical protein
MKFSRTVLAGLVAVSLAMPEFAYANVASRAGPSPISLETGQRADLVAARKHKRLKPGCRAAFCKPGYQWGKYRKWKRKRDFGRFVGGIILGTIIITAAGVVPPRPSPDVCWRWSNNTRTRGYWDYCY